MPLRSPIPDFAGKRWLKISLRCIHLLGFAGVFAATLSGESLKLYWILTLVSGGGLLALEALSNLIWFVQIRGVVMYFKFSLLYTAYAVPSYALPCLVSIILISGFISHAPSSVRYYSLLHGRKITSKRDSKG
ncbi:MAG: hypothetical protein COA42_12770 [Alteromonadaceae bacterium]|nr:MAG: hypothetical protein COA42_12770 [Alteromonadaceae bacterium]